VPLSAANIQDEVQKLVDLDAYNLPRKHSTPRFYSKSSSKVVVTLARVVAPAKVVVSAVAAVIIVLIASPDGPQLLSKGLRLLGDIGQRHAH